MLTNVVVELLVEKVVAAAYRYKGRLYTGPSHPQALEKAIEQGAFGPRIKSWDDFERRYDDVPPGLVDGFVTGDGQFLTRGQAYQHQPTPQISRDDGPASEDYRLRD